MERIHFSQVLNNSKLDLRREYKRLFAMFCLQKVPDGDGNEYPLRDYCAANFFYLPFRGTCVTLNDFDDFYGFHFVQSPVSFDINYLVSFCEYSYNLAANNITYDRVPYICSETMQTYIQQVSKVIELIGYMANQHDFVTDFVPKDQSAIAVSEMVNPELSYKIIEYNHHSMKGNLDQKKMILLSLADKLEPRKKKLKQINTQLETDLFFLFNRMNIRHNNSDPEGSNYISFVAQMGDDELEKWYDDIYQMTLLAFMELDNVDRKKKVKQLQDCIQQKK